MNGEPQAHPTTSRAARLPAPAAFDSPLLDRTSEVLRGRSMPGPSARPLDAGDPTHVIRRVLSDDAGDGSPRSSRTPAGSGSGALPSARSAAGLDLDRLVDRAIERLERRIVEELRRRGRWNRPGVW